MKKEIKNKILKISKYILFFMTIPVALFLWLENDEPSFWKTYKDF